LQDQLDRRTRELHEALEQQTATSEVLNIIRRSPADAQPVFNAIVQSAARLCGAIFSGVYLYDDDRIRIVATNNFTPEATVQIQEFQQLKRPDRSHVGGRAILDRAIVHVHDVLEDPQYPREFALAGGWGAVLAVPLLRDGKPVGAITVGKAEPKPFSDRQVQLLNTFADQALIAIENVRLFESVEARTRDLSEALEQQTATSEVLKVISSSPGELEPVFNTMLENAVRICAARFGSLIFFEGDAYRRAALYNAPAAFVEQQTKDPLCPLTASPTLTRVAKTKKFVQVTDIWRRAHRTVCAHASGWSGSRCFLNISPGGATVHRQADRARSELCRPGGHRNRECAVVQRIARISSAAERDRRRAQGHQPLDFRIYRPS
jgi:putative methionine-R-sulfoxide reductase with GAF domain